MPRTLTEVQAELNAVNTAITKLLEGAQEVEIDTGATRTRYKRASLAQLQAHREFLRAEEYNLEGGASTIRG